MKKIPPMLTLVCLSVMFLLLTGICSAQNPAPPPQPNPPQQPGAPGEAAPPLDEKENLWIARNVDVRSLIQIFAERLEMSVVISPTVSGNISCQIFGKNLTKDQYRIIFETILRESGMRMKKCEGNVFSVERVVGKGLDRLKLKTKEELEKEDAENVLTIGFVPLKFSNTGDMQKFLIPLLSQSGMVLSSPLENVLILIDYPDNLNSIARLCELVDVQFDREMIEIKHTDVDEMVAQLREYYSFEFQRRLLNFVAFPRISRIGIVATSKDLLADAKKLIDKLDVEAENAGRQTFVYQVKYKKAVEIADVLTQFYNEMNPASTSNTNQPRQPRGNFGRPTPTPAPTPAKPPVGGLKPGEENPTEFQDAFFITADEKTNKILVHATPPDYRIIKKTIDQLDVKVKQVLVEVTIGEVILSGDLSMGIEWALRDRGFNGDKTVMADQNSGFSTPMDMLKLPDRSGLQGFSYLLGKTDKFVTFLNALEGSSEMTILASPHILALDNEEASIEITDDIPILSRFSDERGVTTSTDYRKAGVILKVKPNINEDRMVTLEISLESSSVAGQVGDQPSFFTRRFETLAYMDDKQTLFIGGLIKQAKRKNSKGIPFLSRIPVLGVLFGSKSKSKESSELIVVITPRVIENANDVDPINQFIEEERMRRAFAIMKERNIDAMPKNNKAEEKKSKKDKKDKKSSKPKTNYSGKDQEAKDAPKQER